MFYIYYLGMFLHFFVELFHVFTNSALIHKGTCHLIDLPGSDARLLNKKILSLGNFEATRSKRFPILFFTGWCLRSNDTSRPVIDINLSPVASVQSHLCSSGSCSDVRRMGWVVQLF
jgi:hypothetical protein